MYIRKTVSKSKKNSKKRYYTYRLVESIRIGDKVKQQTLLNLGADFSLDQSHWSALSKRIDDILKGHPSLFELNQEIESLAQQYAAQLLSIKAAAVPISSDAPVIYDSVDLESLEHLDPRSIGSESMLYGTIKKLKLDEALESLGFSALQQRTAMGLLIAKAAAPSSEAAALTWLQESSGAGELFGADFSKVSLNSIYRTGDLLFKHKSFLEQYLYTTQMSHFDCEETITLYDLTNTYFEGEAKAAPKAKRGRSKEKRSDAPLVTLAVVLDGSGFVKHSEIFEGNVSEPGTLKEMLDALRSPKGDERDKSTLLDTPQDAPIIVMDAGIASQENIDYVKEKGYRYIVVSRKRQKQFDTTQAVSVKEDKNGTAIVRAQRVVNENGEVELYCHSLPREAKERAMQERTQTLFTEQLDALKEGLFKPRRLKRYEKVLEKIGRLKERHSDIAPYYDIEVIKDKNSDNAIDILYEAKEEIDHKSAMNGIYCLRTNADTLDEETLWGTYVTLTDLEAVFRSLKSELGLRPIYHQKQSRIDAHLFITLLAYSLVHTIRYRLKAKGVHDSWETIRKKMRSQIRVTSRLQLQDGRTVHIRNSSLPGEKQKEIYNALGLTHKPGKATRVYV